jgi:hypothetical protein
MKYGACIVETRPFANLGRLIIDHHLKYLPNDWGLTIYCSRQNIHLLKDVDFGRDTDFILLDPHFSIDDYNNLFKSYEFWDNMPYEKVLIFQVDSKLLREGIEEFLDYDYVGAAWTFQEHGGNGGLSLRSPEIMRKICAIASFSKRNEDVLFCNFMAQEKYGNLAPREVCQKFSTEAVYGLGSLGVHAIEKWLTVEQCNKILTQYK